MICLYPSTLLHTLAPPPQTPPSTPPQSSAWRCCGPWWKGGGTRGQGGARGRGQTTVACVDAAVARRRRSRDRRLGTSCVAACDGMYPARPVGLVIAGGRVWGGWLVECGGAGVPKKSRATSARCLFLSPGAPSPLPSPPPPSTHNKNCAPDNTRRSPPRAVVHRLGAVQTRRSPPRVAVCSL